MEIILLIILVLTIISLPTFISYLIYKFLRRTKIKLVGLVFVIIVPITTLYFLYTAVYPNDNFFFHEYLKVTLREVPKSATIIKKTASYPDFHGDYISVCKIELSKFDYLKLYKSFTHDKQFETLGKLVGSKEFNDIVGKNEKLIKQTFFRKIPDQEQHHYSISFLHDDKTVIIYAINL